MKSSACDVVPEGRRENSPAIHRWECDGKMMGSPVAKLWRSLAKPGVQNRWLEISG